MDFSFCQWNTQQNESADIMYLLILLYTQGLYIIFASVDLKC